MSTKLERADRREEREESRDERRKEGGAQEAAVLAAVMRGLGRPEDFLRADARLLWGNYYRVNVFVGPHAASARVAHSFFLEADAGGKVLTSSPAITRAH